MNIAVCHPPRVLAIIALQCLTQLAKAPPESSGTMSSTEESLSAVFNVIFFYIKKYHRVKKWKCNSIHANPISSGHRLQFLAVEASLAVAFSEQFGSNGSSSCLQSTGSE